MSEVNSIPLERLKMSALNVRKDLDAGQEDGQIEQLAQSIKSKGLINPLTVRSLQDGQFEVVSGQRRLLACQQIGLNPVPCVIRDDLDDSDAVAVSLVENVQRADMHPLDKVHALQALREQKGSLEAVAKETGWSVQTVTKYVRLLDLPPELQHRLTTSEGAIGVGSLSRLAQTFSGDEAVEVYDQIAGFKGRIQDEIIKRSGGDIGRIGDLVADAHEGAFEMRRCGGRFGCEVIADILKGEISEAEFEALVKSVADKLEVENNRLALRVAARGSWKALAIEAE